MIGAAEPALRAFRELIVGDALRAAESAAKVDLQIAGVDLAFEIADPDVGAALLPALWHHVRDDTGTDRRTGAHTRLVVWSSPLSPVPWDNNEIGRGGAIAAISAGPIHVTATADNSSLMLWDGERRLACCWFDGVRGVTRWERAATVRTALHFALSAPQRQLVHGATVGVRGRGAFLAGRGGSGKSTTTFACLESGMQIVGDDYAAVELVGGTPRAWNLYRSMKVGERDHSPGGFDHRRTLIIGDDLPGALTESLELAVLLLPTIVGGATSSLSEATPGEALRALAPSTLLQAPHEDRPSLGILAALARAVPAYHLHLGADHGVLAILEALAR